MPTKYSREFFLASRFNRFFEHELNLPSEDYYSRLSVKGFLQLKSTLSDINNIFTMKVSIGFIYWVSEILSLNDETTVSLISQLLKTKPNTNGFDIEFSTSSLKLIAEVKCNVPINGGKVYGSAQKNGIAKDIEALIKGKNKSTFNASKCVKFMVFLDRPEIREATEHFVKNMRDYKENICFFDNTSQPFVTEKIYIVFVTF